MKCLPCEQTANALKKTIVIGEAWVNVVVPNPEVEELALKRTLICSSCKSAISFMKINGNDVYKCKECSCPIVALTRSREKCKLNKW